MIPYPHIDPIAFRVPLPFFGQLPVRWYSLAYLGGFLLGWRYMLHLVALDPENETAPRRMTRLHVDDFLTWAVLGVILGGRIGYILFYNPSLYFAHPLEVFRLWDGGMAFHGGAAGVIIGMIIFAWRRHINGLRLSDMVCAAVPIGLFFGRIANFINGELFGRITTVPWGMVFPNGGEVARHPSELYEAGLEGLVLFTLLALLIHRRAVRERPGLVSAIFLLGYAAARIALENYREPDAQLGFLFAHVTMGELLSTPMIVGGLILIWWSCLRRPSQA